MPKLKPLRKDEDLNAIPVDQPVLVELEPAVASTEEEIATEKVAVPEREEGEDPAVKALKDQMEAMRAANDAELTREREARRKAEDARVEAERQAKAAKTQTADAETSAVESGLAAAQRERDAAKVAIKMAFDSGDADKLAEAQERLGLATADIREFERSASVLQERKTQAEREQQEQPRTQAAPDVLAAIDGNSNLMPVEKTWLKDHQDAVIDPKRNNELGVAYDRATRAGHVRGTPQYFQFIEEFMGYSKPAKTTDNEEEETAIVAAPVSRDTRSSVTGQPSNSRIHLSPEQREMARSMGLSDVEYARGVVQMQGDKKANPEKYFARQ